MEREANYVAVGAFILLVIAMAVGFVMWYTNANDGREYALYEIYFSGSVSGLDRGSPVRYLGVDVGRVRRLSIDRKDAGRVAVVAEIDRSAPISSATRASLGLQGVTGLLYVNLREVPELVGREGLPQGEHYPVIESVASEIDVFLSSLPELMGRANTLLDRFSLMLSEQNIEGIAETIDHVRKATAGLPQTTREISRLIVQLQGTVDEVRSGAQALRGIADDTRPEVRAAVARLSEAMAHLAQASERMDAFTRSSETQLGHFGEHGLFQIEQLLRDVRSAAREFRDLSRSLQENPSQILYEPPQSGVEIDP